MSFIFSQRNDAPNREAILFFPDVSPLKMSFILPFDLAHIITAGRFGVHIGHTPKITIPRLNNIDPTRFLVG